MVENSTWTTSTANQTRKLAGRLDDYWEKAAAVALVGPLGSGKTTFVRGVVEALGGDPGRVKSPTFTLVNQYDTAAELVVHADLYRLDSSQGQFTAGLEDYFSEALVLVEWAEKWELSWPRRTVTLNFDYEGEQTRRISLEENPPDAIND